MTADEARHAVMTAVRVRTEQELGQIIRAIPQAGRALRAIIHMSACMGAAQTFATMDDNAELGRRLNELGDDLVHLLGFAVTGLDRREKTKPAATHDGKCTCGAVLS